MSLRLQEQYEDNKIDVKKPRNWRDEEKFVKRSGSPPAQSVVKPTTPCQPK